MSVMNRSGFLAKLGEEKFAANIDDALSRAASIVSKNAQ
jgi:hypothetical protein